MKQPQSCVQVGNLRFGNSEPLVLIAGINVLESQELAMQVAEHLHDVCQRLQLGFVFKASFDKANRTSLASFRGPGLEQGLRMLAEVRERFGVPVITDIHLPEQAAAAASVCDMLQIPAFLCRQTDLLQAAAETGAALHIKKAQFLAASDMRHVLDKCLRANNDRLLLCERGSQYGYHNLVVDMLGFEIMKEQGCPVTFDVTHSLQLPGGAEDRASGRRTAALKLALAGVSQGLAGLFLECHPQPDKALCDGASALPLQAAEAFLQQVTELDRLVKRLPAITLG